MGIQETKRRVFLDHFLNYIAGPCEFNWLSLPAKNTAGGILVGFKKDRFEVISHSCQEFSISIVVRDSLDDFSWQLVVVYGSPYLERKVEFIAELHDIMEQSSLPTMLGGDFNLVRGVHEKNNGVIHANHTMLFNDWINRWALLELKPANRIFTWSNNQVDPIMATLDRILVSTDWEAKFPLSNFRTLPRPISDHAPSSWTLGLLIL